MLKPVTNRYTKEEELEFGKQIQESLKAQDILQSQEVSEQEYYKLQDIINKGQYAQNELFNIEIGLANKLSSRLYQNAGVRYSINDIAQDAYVALIEATETFNPNKNCRFSTYSYYHIYKKISTSLNMMRSVRLPENKMGQYLKITKAENEYMKTHKNPDDEEKKKYVLNKTKIKPEVYLTIKQSMQPVTSTTAPIGEGGSTFGDLLEDKNAVTKLDINNPELLHLMTCLTPEEQDIVSLAYSVGRTGISYNKYLKEHNLTPKDMSRLVKKAVRKMRKQVMKDNTHKEAL